MRMTVLLFAATTTALHPATALAAEFAPSGTAGTLTVKVEAVGAGKHKASPGAGLDSREWKVKNSGQFTIRVKAMEPMGDASAENQSKMAAAREAYDKTFSQKDQDIQEQWADKLDACDGNEACENRVRAQMLADPQFQRMIQKAQGAGPAMIGSMKAVDRAPRYQAWATDPTDPSPASGSLQLDLQENAYGVIDTAGGGKVNVSCRWSGSHPIKSGSSDSKVGARMLVDARTSTFEIRIPADAFSARLPESCADSKSGPHGASKNTRRVQLIGGRPAPGVKDFAEALTFKGKLGSTRSPQTQGKETITTDLFDANSPAASVPLKVTIEWQLAAGGR